MGAIVRRTRAMKRSAFVLVLFIAAASAAQTATLTITPDKPVYQVGEEIVLNVFGDSGGAQASIVVGRILFDAGLADYVTSHQDALTSIGGQLTWFLSPLEGGDGFGDAFEQSPSVNPFPVDGPLTASVTLVATAPGTLAFSWATDGLLPLDFFGLTNAPGGSVTIVPEPSTGVLVVLGLMATGLTRGRGERVRRGSTIPISNPRQSRESFAPGNA